MARELAIRIRENIPFYSFSSFYSPSCSKVDEQELKERDEFILMRVFIARSILSHFMCRPAFGDIERRSSHVTLQKRWAPKPFLSMSGQIADRSRRARPGRRPILNGTIPKLFEIGTGLTAYGKSRLPP
jgi:hypothetical protein